MKEELAGIERYRGPKERSLDQYASSLEAMQTTKEGLESELHQVWHHMCQRDMPMWWACNKTTKSSVHSVALHVTWLQCTFLIITMLLSNNASEFYLRETQNFSWEIGYLDRFLWFPLATHSNCCILP
jgi:hypothetical protein